MKRLAIVFLCAAAVMVGAFRFAGWYADNSALPRYCDNPGETVRHVRAILTSKNPAEDRRRRPYLVAAKLIFLVPQRDAETTEAYLDRLHQVIAERCNGGVR